MNFHEQIIYYVLKGVTHFLIIIIGIWFAIALAIYALVYNIFEWLNSKKDVEIPEWFHNIILANLSIVIDFISIVFLKSVPLPKSRILDLVRSSDEEAKNLGNKIAIENNFFLYLQEKFQKEEDDSLKISDLVGEIDKEDTDFNKRNTLGYTKYYYQKTLIDDMEYLKATGAVIFYILLILTILNTKIN